MIPKTYQRAPTVCVAFYIDQWMAVLCVCRHCSQLFCIAGEGVLASVRKDSDSSRNRVRRVVTVTRGPIEGEIAELIADMAGNENESVQNLFPICASCLSNSVFQLETLCEHYIRATGMMKSLGDVPSEILFGEIEKKIGEDEPQKATASIPKSPSRKAIARRVEPKKEAKRELDLISVEIPRIKVVLPVVFHIGFDHLYGTVNGSRIGFFRGGGLNPRCECNAGLKMVAHLAWATMKAFDVESDTVVLPTGMIEYNGQMCKLKIPKTMDQKAVKKVDMATVGLFRACKHIFAARKLVEFCSMAPFLIDTEKKQIEQVDYEFDTKKLEQWSIALKHLLFNFKLIHNRGLDRLQA